MKKNVLVAFMASALLFSCSHDATENGEQEFNLNLEQNSWKTAVISTEIAQNLQQISHYEFEAKALSKLVTSKSVTYVWFDLGINNHNQITLAATAVDNKDVIIGEIPSRIIMQQEFTPDFSKLAESSFMYSNEQINRPSSGKHLLAPKAAFKYVMKMQTVSQDLEERFTYGDVRVERFGIEATAIQEMIASQDVAALTVFFGINAAQKATTVFIGKDVNGNLHMDMDKDHTIRDFTRPCPPWCDPD